MTTCRSAFPFFLKTWRLLLSHSRVVLFSLLWTQADRKYILMRDDYIIQHALFSFCRRVLENKTFKKCYLLIPGNLFPCHCVALLPWWSLPSQSCPHSFLLFSCVLLSLLKFRIVLTFSFFSYFPSFSIPCLHPHVYQLKCLSPFFLKRDDIMTVFSLRRISCHILHCILNITFHIDQFSC